MKNGKTSVEDSRKREQGSIGAGLALAAAGCCGAAGCAAAAGPVAGAFIAGMLVTGAAVWLIMPKLMLVTHISKYDDVDKTCDALKTAIEAEGWSCPAVRDMNASTAKFGVQLTRDVRIVELCKADYAKEVLADNPEVSTLMPCAWGVYKNGDTVYITGMNLGLMGKMFGGMIAKVMGGKASRDEQAILSHVTK